MVSISYTITFKDGSEAKLTDNFNNKSDIFTAFASGFKNNGEIDVNGIYKSKFENVKSIKVNFHD